MAVILQLSRTLRARPPQGDPKPFELRTFQGAADIPVWLELRRRAFAGEAVGIGEWNSAHFRREFLDKPWWNPRHMWFALAPADQAGEAREIGTVTLAFRSPPEKPQAVIHWLAVLPKWRRQGVAQLLIRSLEAVCWDAGWREIRLETHVRWSAAVALYRSLGYCEIGQESPAGTVRPLGE